MKIRQFVLASPLLVFSYCANAQTADVLTTCGSITLDVGSKHILTVDSTGKACINIQSTVTTQRGNDYPVSAVPITASATGTTAATTATLAANATLKTYLCTMSIRANATAAATGNATVTGTVTGTLNFTQWTAPLASGIGTIEMTFTPCVPSSAINTAIAVVSAAPGSGGVVSVTAAGYQGN